MKYSSIEREQENSRDKRRAGQQESRINEKWGK